MCCGSPPINLNCEDTSVVNSIVVPPFIPEASFSIICTDTDASNNIQGTTQCVDGSQGCSCQDRAYCRCIQLNQTITLIPNILLNNIYCEGEFPTVSYTINDEVPADLPVLDFDNYLIPIEFSFSSKGKYTIKLTVTNCCGTCTYEHTLTVGASITIERVDCYKFKFNDFYNFGSIGSRTLNVVLKNVDLEIVKQWQFTNYSGTTDVLFELPSDGVYVVSYELVDQLGVVIVYKEYSIYEFCSLISCYEKMITQKMCITNDCKDDATIKNISEKLNEFVAIASAFYASLDIQFGKTYGNFEYKSEYLNTLQNHQFLLNTLSKICGKCNIQATSNVNFSSEPVCIICNGGSI
jgi:hypothetical protein